MKTEKMRQKRETTSEVISLALVPSPGLEPFQLSEQDFTLCPHPPFPLYQMKGDKENGTSNLSLSGDRKELKLKV